jgi:hypothetical protein
LIGGDVMVVPPVQAIAREADFQEFDDLGRPESLHREPR